MKSREQAERKEKKKPENLSELLTQFGFKEEKASEFATEDFRKVIYTAYRASQGGSFISGHEWRGIVEKAFGRSVDPIEYFEKVKEMIRRTLRQGYPLDWFLEIVETKKDLREELKDTRSGWRKASERYRKEVEKLTADNQGLLGSIESLETALKRYREDAEGYENLIKELRELWNFSIIGKDLKERLEQLIELLKKRDEEVRGHVLKREEEFRKVLEKLGNLRSLALGLAVNAQIENVEVDNQDPVKALDDLYNLIWMLFGEKEIPMEEEES